MITVTASNKHRNLNTVILIDDKHVNQNQDREKDRAQNILINWFKFKPILGFGLAVANIITNNMITTSNTQDPTRR